MRYFKKLSSDGYVFALEKRETTTAGIEITEAEYNTLLSEIREKAVLVNQLINGEITIDAIPVAWQEEIQRRVDERRDAENADTGDDPELTAEEALEIIMGGAL